MNPETIKQVLDSLEKNGTAALDGIATNAAMQAWMNLFVLALLMLCTGGLIRLMFWLFGKAKNAYGREEDVWLIGAVISAIGSAIFLCCVIVGMFELPSNIATIKNPRAAAIRLLLQR